jgi:hypothetical protein
MCFSPQGDGNEDLPWQKPALPPSENLIKKNTFCNWNILTFHKLIVKITAHSSCRYMGILTTIRSPENNALLLLILFYYLIRLTCHTDSKTMVHPSILSQNNTPALTKYHSFIHNDCKKKLAILGCFKHFSKIKTVLVRTLAHCWYNAPLPSNGLIWQMQWLDSSLSLAHQAKHQKSITAQEQTHFSPDSELMLTDVGTHEW